MKLNEYKEIEMKRYINELKFLKSKVDDELERIETEGENYHPSISLDGIAENVAEHIRTIRLLSKID